MNQAYVVGAVRTPIGKFMGSLASLSAPQLAAQAIRELVARSGVDASRIEEVVMGNVLTSGVGQAPARQAALLGGLPETVPAVTINKVCGSGLKAVMLADQAIRAGDARVVVAGGMENMSRSPHLLVGGRTGLKFGHQQLLDSMLHDGLWCATENVGMGSLSDYIAKKHDVSRQSQDEFSAESHRRAVAATEAGKFIAETTSISVVVGKSATTIDRDEGPRGDSTAATLAKLRPAFAPDGTTTAGNASQISDGAAVVMVADAATAATIQSPIKARIVASAVSGVAPRDLFIAPVAAIEMVLAKAKMSVSDIDLFELNEAFASQCLACLRPLGIPLEKVNVHGGAIALGHPIGASGARVLVTLLHALADRGLRRGVASLCLGGGNAVAMVVERD